MIAALRHLRLGVRSDPRRSRGREHHLHAGARASTSRTTPARRSRRCAACTATIMGCGSIRRTARLLYNVNDGGFYQSADAGKTWTFARRGGRRRSSTTSRSTRARRRGRTDRSRTSAAAAASVDVGKGRERIPAVEWSEAPGGEGSNQAIDPAEPGHRVFARVLRKLHARGRRRSSRAAAGGAGRPRPRRARRRHEHPSGGRKVADAEFRAQWMAPIIVSPHDAGDHLRRLSVRLPFDQPRRRLGEDQPGSVGNDPSQMLLKSSNAIPYQTIVALAESPKTKGLLYAGTDDGTSARHAGRRSELDRSDGRLAGAEVDLAGRAVAAHDEGTVYVTQRGREDDDFARVRLQVDRLREDIHQHRRATFRPDR